MKKYFLLALSFLSFGAFASKPTPWQVHFQEPATEIMEEIIKLHDFVMYFMIAVVLVVVALLVYVCLRYSKKVHPNPLKFTHNAPAEIIWTVIPVIILVIIAIPSFKLLKKEETEPIADLTVKVVGYQWYWKYQYPDNGNFEFDSYMIKSKDLKDGDIRLLEVDNRIVIPQGKTVRFLITAGDVLHSFTVPSMGFKKDAVPGRINEVFAKVDKTGVYYGQCSELCGVDHGFMPIAIEVVSEQDFAQWIEQAKVKFALKDSFLKLASIKNK
jgi:cytochrome c oxidase subunit II